MDEIDLKKLFAICKGLFRTDREIEILAHVALEFCRGVERGKSVGFSSRRITTGINTLFKDDKPVEDANVKRFLWRFTFRPRDEDLIPKLGAFIVSECVKNEANMKLPVLAVLLRSWDFVAEVKRRLELDTSEAEKEMQHEHHFDGIVRGFRRITQHPMGEDIFEDFFATRDTDLKDVRYYLSYRYSLTRAKLVKTFLSISTPAYNGKHVFEYRHTHRHTSVRTEILRRTRGVLLDIHRSYYLLGTSVLQHRGGTWPYYAEGIQVISLEKEQFTQESPGLRALFFTNNNSMYPMIGRSALILLGSEKEVGRQDYRTFGLDVFSNDKLDETVRSDLAQFPRIDQSQAIAFIRDVIDLNHMNLEHRLPDELRYQVRKPAVARPQIPPQETLAVRASEG
jgi:hypothetical protein